MSGEIFGLADCNNFFVSCERVFRPDLRDKPVVVLSNNDGCVISRSNESKALGIKMGEPFFKIRDFIKDNDVAVFSSNYALYGDMSRRVMSMLSAYTPRLDIYSVDEAILDLSGLGDADAVRAHGKRMVRDIKKGIGIPVSLGVAATKTLAKMASKYAKSYPGYEGVCVIETDSQREKALKQFPVADVWGIGRKMLRTMEYHGVRTAWDFVCRSESWVRREFNVVALRTWRELQGDSCINLDDLPYRKSICVSRSFPGQGITDLKTLEEIVAYFASECARKLREQNTHCSQILFFAYTSRFRTDQPGNIIQRHLKLRVPTNDTAEIAHAVLQCLREDFGTGRYSYKKAGVVVWDLTSSSAVQTVLFDDVDRGKQQALIKAVDSINRKNGRNTVKVATMGSTKVFVADHQYESPCYTTRIEDVLRLKV